MRWDWYFLALVVLSSVVGFLLFIANKKEGCEHRLFYFLLGAFGVSCILWCLTLFAVIALYGV